MSGSEAWLEIVGRKVRGLKFASVHDDRLVQIETSARSVSTKPED
jgi:hypothetical protein